MSRHLPYFIFGLAVACPLLPAFTVAERAASAHPGMVVRWTGTGTTRCAMNNGTPDPFPHMGMDCLTPEGSPILAVADGRVVLTANLFFAGNAVFIDHGNGLISMYFHLAKIDVREGEEVAKGHVLGTVGSTGRSTGPHLFFGVRWHDTRIDPASLFGEPDKMPDVHAAPARSTVRG